MSLVFEWLTACGHRRYGSLSFSGCVDNSPSDNRPAEGPKALNPHSIFADPFMAAKKVTTCRCPHSRGESFGQHANEPLGCLGARAYQQLGVNVCFR